MFALILKNIGKNSGTTTNTFWIVCFIFSSSCKISFSLKSLSYPACFTIEFWIHQFQLLEVPLNKVWQDADSELLSCPAFWSRFCSEAIDLIIKWWPILFFLSHYDINRPLHSIFCKVLIRISKRIYIDNAEKNALKLGNVPRFKVIR